MVIEKPVTCMEFQAVPVPPWAVACNDYRQCNANLKILDGITFEGCIFKHMHQSTITINMRHEDIYFFSCFHLFVQPLGDWLYCLTHLQNAVICLLTAVSTSHSQIQFVTCCDVTVTCHNWEKE